MKPAYQMTDDELDAERERLQERMDEIEAEQARRIAEAFNEERMDCYQYGRR